MACTLAESLNDPFHRKLRQLRCLRCRFDCYRVERTSSRAGVSPAEVQRLSRRTFSPTNCPRRHTPERIPPTPASPDRHRAHAQTILAKRRPQNKNARIDFRPGQCVAFRPKTEANYRFTVPPQPPSTTSSLGGSIPASTASPKASSPCDAAPANTS
jgi:AraC-like DNA-binding protein